MQSIRKAQVYVAAALLLLFSSATGYSLLARSDLLRTRTSRWLSTKSNVHPSALQSAVADDEATQDRWFFPWPKEERLQGSNAEAPSADEKAVDEYLEFLERRYR
jgi:hypothetical protein